MTEEQETTQIETAVQTWKSEEFGTIRSMTINNEPWFVAKDLAKALGYTNAQKAVRDHTDEEDRWVNETGTHPESEIPYVIDKVGRRQYPVFINESGLYSLIFGSKLDSAKKFKHWVTSEVLPAIRKAGNYTASPVVNLRDMTVTIQELKERVSALEQSSVKNSAVPVDVDFTDSREKVSELVKKAARQNGTPERLIWYDLYKGYEKMTGIPLMKSAQAMNLSVISYVDVIGRMESLNRFAEQVLWFV